MRIRNAIIAAAFVVSFVVTEMQAIDDPNAIRPMRERPAVRVYGRSAGENDYLTPTDDELETCRSINIQLLSKAAEKGDAEAQCDLGWAYYQGDEGVPQDYAEATKWWHRAAEQGFVNAQYMLGRTYYRGEGAPEDYAKAAKWFRCAAKQKVKSRFTVHWISLAQKFLGMMYVNGEGVSQDYAEAAKWFRRSAELRNADAQFHFGMMCFHGEGVPQNYIEAVEWLERATEHGHAWAHFNLGMLYWIGNAGISQNSLEAYILFSIAAATGSDFDEGSHKAAEKAAVKRDLVAQKLSSTELSAAKVEIVRRRAKIYPGLREETNS